MSDPLTRAEIVIDLRAVVDNWSRIGEIAAGTGVAAMVKADGYGLGAIAVTGVLKAAGCRDFFVAEIGEAIALRDAHPDVEIFVLSGAQPGTLDDLVAHDLVPVLLDLAQLDAWSDRSGREGRRLRANVHLDTAMNRTGFDRAETNALLREPDRLDAIEVVQVMSHLACADDPDDPTNVHQLAAFRELRRRLPHGIASLANTPGVALGPEYHFDHVRPGVGLYGADPTPRRGLGLTPVVTVNAPVLQVRTADPGETVGYGATHRLDEHRCLATIGVGYGDGFLRSQSGRGYVAFGGHRAPILGRISMDLVTVDVTDLPDTVAIGPGAPAELIGPTITIDDVADAAGTIAYEILTSLGNRYRRRHIG